MENTMRNTIMIVTRNIALLLVLISLLAGCDWDPLGLGIDEEFTQTVDEFIDNNLDQIISLEIVGSDMLIANGADTTGLIALIPEDTDSDKRDITFKTTVGRFKTGGNELTVRATPSKEMYPGKLVARATFKADTNTSPASVTATVKSYTTKPETITFIRSYATGIPSAWA